MRCCSAGGVAARARERIAELEDRLRKASRNSSMPSGEGLAKPPPPVTVAAEEDPAQAGRPRRTRGHDAHSFHHRDRKEDQRGCYGTHAHGYERGARSGPDIRSGKWWRWIETERFRHMVPPENLKIDCVPAEYPDDSADPPQPSHRQVSGSCRCCMDLVYHGCWLAACSPAMPPAPHPARRFPGFHSSAPAA